MGVSVNRGNVGVFSQWGRWGKIFVQPFSNLFLKTLTEGALTTEAGSLFQYFTTLTGNDETPLQVVVRTLEFLVGVLS